MVVKTKWASGNLSSLCHHIIIIKNLKSLTKLVSENVFDFKKLFPIVFQEVVEDVTYCKKYYNSFGTKFVQYFNSFELTKYDDLAYIDGFKDLKTIITNKGIDEN